MMNERIEYKVSKYIKNELKHEDSFKSSKQDWSSTDEENFNTIINSSENQNNDGKKVEKKVADELTDSFEYSKDDSNQFEKLMKFKQNPYALFLKFIHFEYDQTSNQEVHQH